MRLIVYPSWKMDTGIVTQFFGKIYKFLAAFYSTLPKKSKENG